MTLDFVIRPEAPADAPRLRYGLSPMRLTPDDRARGAWAWIAWQGELAIGGITVVRSDAEGRFMDLAGLTAVIPTLWVEPSFREQGVGRALLVHAIVDLRARGFQRVMLHTNTGSTAGRRLYESSGWVVTEADGNVIGYSLSLI